MTDTMMNLLDEFRSYLPIKPKSICEIEYIDFIYSSIQTNIENSSWQFAYLGFHMFLLVFTQSTVLKLTSIDKLKLLLTHENKKTYKRLENLSKEYHMAELPYISERTLFRLLRSCDVPEEVIAKLEEACETRNSIAHCNYSLSINSEDSLQNQVSEIISLMSQICRATNPAFLKIYKKAFSWFDTIEEVNDQDIENFVEQYLISDNYMSIKDIEFIMHRKKSNLPYETDVKGYSISTFLMSIESHIVSLRIT